ncbi:TIGR01777 family protein [Nostocoides sp. F2B08]|uniref:TIGR01777 family oxidoreductase n=1 Tax=Nostocoides sp. F2B08 TaxID=2653936 RepID=UPI001262C0DE|nr:TIGR01777 family oxidoreductase [Tetrasphaera sp. F2B08]KAB7742487.1 TIGR01777 family protein [Tetrasphaera sp. F2B08]
MRIAISGSSGLIGSALTRHLRERGDDVVHLVRRPVRESHERQWDPDSVHLDPQVLADCDGVVSLHGSGIGDKRWTPAYKREILTSRTHGTTAIATALAELADRGRRLRWVGGSAVGFYGDRGEEPLDETSPAGNGYLPEVVTAWEGATEPAERAGVAVAHIRTGIVLSPEGGALKPLLLLLKFGLGGPFGRGRAWWPWITLQDETLAITYLLDHEDITGPVNLVGPEEARQGAIVTAIARAMHRPALLPVPPPALRVVMGEFADDILSSQRVRPRVLTEHGFTFDHATVADAAAWITR